MYSFGDFNLPKFGNFQKISNNPGQAQNMNM